MTSSRFWSALPAAALALAACASPARQDAPGSEAESDVPPATVEESAVEGDSADEAHSPPKPILTLIEHRDDRRTRTVTDEYAIVDVNSEIEIKIDGAALRERVAGELEAGREIELRAELLGMLLGASEDGLKAIGEVPPAELGDPSTDSYKAALKKAANVTLRLSPVIDDEERAAEFQPVAGRFRADLQAALQLVADVQGSAIDQYAAVFDVMANEAKILRAEVDGLLEAHGAYVRFGGWLSSGNTSQPVHLPGFDEYPEGEYFKVDRFGLALDKKTKDAYASAVAQAKELNAKGKIVFTELVEAEAKRFLEQELAPVRTCLEELRQSLLDTRDRLDAQHAALAAKIDALRATWSEDLARLEAIRARYASGKAPAAADAVALLDQFFADLDWLLGRVGAWRDGLTTALADLTGSLQGASQELVQAASGLQSKAQSCGGTLVDVADRLRQRLRGVEAASDHAEVAWQGLEFGKEVLQLDLADVPASTRLDLERTGRRERGDSITFVLAAGRRANAESAQKVSSLATLEHRQLDLYLTLPYLSLSAGVVFANPNGSASVDSRFQAGASYSILLKDDSESSWLYNQWLDLGLGLNVAALDFDNDENLELGIAVVGAALRDWLQVGYGYNVNEDRWYFVFGLKLPFTDTTLPVPGSGSSEIVD